jgi:hypothetical protein
LQRCSEDFGFQNKFSGLLKNRHRPAAVRIVTKTKKQARKTGHEDCFPGSNGPSPQSPSKCLFEACQPGFDPRKYAVTLSEQTFFGRGFKKGIQGEERPATCENS